MSQIIATEINNKDVKIIIGRKRSSHTSGYKALVNALIQRMTDTQIELCTITNNNKSIISMDLVTNEFDYRGPIEGDCGSQCICGVRILHEHCICNIETNDSFIIGSTCCDHWTRHSALSYKPRHHKRTLQLCFKTFKDKWQSMPIMNVGKYKGKTMKYVVKQDLPYAKYVFNNFSGDIKDDMCKTIIKYQ